MTVPIIPGGGLPPVPIIPQPQPKRRRWLVPVIAVAAVASLALAGAGFVWLRDAATSAGIGVTKLRGAYEACGQIGRLADGDTTLLLDLYGDDQGTGTVRPEDLRCYVAKLPIPTYVVTRMEKTRALDGQVTQAWDGFEASWTYHPDEGLDLVIREV